MAATEGLPLALIDPASEVDPVFWETVLDISDPWGGELEMLVLEHIKPTEPPTRALRLAVAG